MAPAHADAECPRTPVPAGKRSASGAAAGPAIARHTVAHAPALLACMSMPPLPAYTFDLATPTDIPALIALVTAAYRGDASRAGWTTEADLLDGQRIDAAGLLADLQRPRSVILLAKAGPAIHGCCHLADEDGAGYFGMFAVDPQLQGSGLGKQLMARAEAWVRSHWGRTTMRMTVIDCRQELIAFYQRRGYVRTGITKPFPYGDARFGLPRRDDLRFEILEKTLEPIA